MALSGTSSFFVGIVGDLTVIDRKTYLEMCQMCAVIIARDGVPQLPRNLLVKHNGIEYYPISYSLSFDGNGKAEHRAIFHDLKANSISGCLLSELEKVEC